MPCCEAAERRHSLYVLYMALPKPRTVLIGRPSISMNAPPLEIFKRSRDCQATTIERVEHAPESGRGRRATTWNELRLSFSAASGEVAAQLLVA